MDKQFFDTVMNILIDGYLFNHVFNLEFHSLYSLQRNIDTNAVSKTMTLYKIFICISKLEKIQKYSFTRTSDEGTFYHGQ